MLRTAAIVQNRISFLFRSQFKTLIPGGDLFKIEKNAWSLSWVCGEETKIGIKTIMLSLVSKNNMMYGVQWKKDSIKNDSGIHSVDMSVFHVHVSCCRAGGVWVCSFYFIFSYSN